LGSWRAACRQGERVELERHGDVAARAATGHEGAQGGFEGLQRAQQALVMKGLVRLCGKTLVDGGGTAVRHRVAGDHVAVGSARGRGHGWSACRGRITWVDASSASSRVNLKREETSSRSRPWLTSGGTAPKGPAFPTMAWARRSSSLLPELCVTMASTTRPLRSSQVSMTRSP